MNRLFAYFVVAAMVLGVAVGWILNQTLAPAELATVTDGLSVVTDLFLRLIKMVIAPLVLTTLVAGVAHMDDAGAVGRVGLKTMGWFITASIVSLLVGLLMVHLLQPGVGLDLVPPATADSGVAARGFDLKTFVTHLVPVSVVEAMAKNEILQIVVFSLLVGVAIAAAEDRAPAVIAVVEQVAAIMLRVTGYVMKAAPFAIFAALAATVAKQGVGVLATYAKFVGGFYLSLAILWAILGVAALIALRSHALPFFRSLRTPALLAFSTASSEAAYPRTLEALEQSGVSRRVASFVLPLGYSFNLDGSMMYCTFAVLFIAQAYGVELSIAQQIGMLLMLMVTSKGIAGVPRASLVVIAATLPHFNLPEAGLLLILAVDHLLDMGRSGTNVIGNSVAAVVVAKWERQFSPPAAAE